MNATEHRPSTSSLPCPPAGDVPLPRLRRAPSFVRAACTDSGFVIEDWSHAAVRTAARANSRGSAAQEGASHSAPTVRERFFNDPPNSETTKP